MPIRWEPAIYEHKAALIGRSPAEVATSAELLTEAVLREHEVYQTDLLTVGLDVYNIEAEALGAKVIAPAENECPDLEGLLFDLGALPEPLVPPAIPDSGRFALLLAAGKEIRGGIGDHVAVRVAASGPVTMAAKLVGVESLILSLCMEDGHAVRLLEFCTGIAESWCVCLGRNGLDAVVFDSIAAPPMFSPDLYAAHVLPLHRRLMASLEASGQQERELVIGGNTTPIAPLLPETGANMLLCDFAADAHAFKEALGNHSALQIRRNLNPALLREGHDDALIEAFAADLAVFTTPIAGTGILPYDFRPSLLIDFRRAVLELSGG